MGRIMQLLYSSCIGCSSSSEGEYDDTTNYSEYDNEHEQDISSNQHQDDFQLTGIIETCRHCNGYGMVQDGLYGVARYCMFCGGNRVVDAAINRLPDDFFDNVEGYGLNSDDRGTRREQIEKEIAQHERKVESMEEQLEYIEGSINRTYLEQQIIQERYEIKRLQSILNNMD